MLLRSACNSSDFPIRNKVTTGRSDIEKGKEDENVEEWKNTFRSKLRCRSPFPTSCCIFRVPEVIRSQKKEAYEPVVVSIGPFHRGGEQFQLVEHVKGWYLQGLLSRLKITLDDLIDRTKELEEEARACYSEPFLHLNQNKFVEMLILDGCFLIQLFRKALLICVDGRDPDDPIFNLYCMLEYIYHDLLLLENQLPWSVLEFFYDLIESSNPTKSSLSVLVIDFFSRSLANPWIFSYPEEPADSGKEAPPVHILYLIRTALLRKQYLPPIRIQMNFDHMPRRIPSAITLSKVGVKFKMGDPGCIMNMQFKYDDGVLIIPRLDIDSRSASLFRNLIAYEQFYRSCSHKIASYAVLMDSLVGSIEDVNLLCEQGILVNTLSDEDAFQFFKQLYNYDTTLIRFHYADLCKDINDYCVTQRRRSISAAAKRKKWIQQFKEDYFGTPWKILSWIVAGMILVLAILQTLYTVVQYYRRSSYPN